MHEVVQALAAFKAEMPRVGTAAASDGQKATVLSAGQPVLERGCQLAAELEQVVGGLKDMAQVDPAQRVGWAYGDASKRSHTLLAQWAAEGEPPAGAASAHARQPGWQQRRQLPSLSRRGNNSSRRRQRGGSGGCSSSSGR